ncbi:MAG: hypothetical protein JO293_08490, partial [Candidatus Eremiobacteraeota bacterium]|nr:hypothetical protein [Candidatus Eremiobacteraeota bacterium]
MTSTAEETRMRRIGSALAVSLVVATLFGCTSPSGNSVLPVPAVRTYTAVGASDAVGVGAVQCPTAGVPPMPSPPSCPGGNGYVPMLAGMLTGPRAQVNLFDLGISGAVIGPDIQADTALCFGAPGNFITNELPVVNAQSNVVTIFAGGNDTNAIFSHVAIACGSCTPQQVATMITTDVTNFGHDYATLLG